MSCRVFLPATSTDSWVSTASGGLGGFCLQVHLVRWYGQGGRVPDIPGAPYDFPASLRQMFYNLMISGHTPA